MRVLAVHPGPLMYTKIFLRLEPLGLELVAQSARAAGHDVRLIDLQVEGHDAFRLLLPQAVFCVGGHSASFTATAIIEHGDGAIDCVIKGEGEAAMPLLLAAI